MVGQSLSGGRFCAWTRSSLSVTAVSEGLIGMKLAGFLLLMAGWGIVISTLPLLPSLTMRTAFVLAGMAVEFVGLGLVVRSHRVAKE
jgi:hypothetical protein